VFGGSILIVAMLLGVAPDSGWFMYTPLSSGTYSPGINADVWLLGITFVEISALCAAGEITVTILKIRAPGMTVDRMPLPRIGGPCALHLPRGTCLDLPRAGGDHLDRLSGPGGAIDLYPIPRTYETPR
jgi:hypothetical protein